MMAKDKIKIGKFSQMTYYLLREILVKSCERSETTSKQ